MSDMPQLPDGSLAKPPQPGHRRLRSIDAKSFAIIDALTLNIYHGEVRQDVYAFNNANVPEVVAETFSVEITDISDPASVEAAIDRLRTNFEPYMLSANVELETQVRKKMMIMLYFADFLQRTGVVTFGKPGEEDDYGKLGAYYDRFEHKPNWMEITRVMNEYLNSMPEYRDVFISPADIQYVFDYECSLDEFKEKIAQLFYGTIVIPFTIIFQVQDSGEEAEEIYLKTQAFAEAGFATVSIVNPSFVPKHIQASLGARENELLAEYFNKKANFFQIAGELDGDVSIERDSIVERPEYPFRPSLFTKVMTEFAKMHTRGFATGTIFDSAAISFLDLSSREPDDAVIRFQDLSKLATYDKNSEINSAYFDNIALDMLGLVQAILNIIQVNYFTAVEADNVIRAINWYVEELTKYLGEGEMEKINIHRKQLNGKTMSFYEMVDYLKQIFEPSNFQAVNRD